MSRNSRAGSRMATPLVNAEVAENVVKSTIYRNWKQIQQQCRQRDLDNSGTINVVDLKGNVLLSLHHFVVYMVKKYSVGHATMCMWSYHYAPLQRSGGKLLCKCRSVGR